MQRNEKWMIIANHGDYVEIGKRHNISPVLARILRNRGIEGDGEIRDYLNTDGERLKEESCSGFKLKDMEKAVDLVLNKIREKKKLRIAGDYDIDGVSAVYILLKGLRKLNADVDHRIPHRIYDGYGLNEKIIREAYDAGVDTLITCDNGIAALKETALLKSLGMTMVITDHHEVPFHMENGEKKEDLPEADAIVDPKRQGCPYPYKSICGAYVAYKFICCLYEKAGIGREMAEEFLEMAAFATIGDVMPLTGENRILVREGLKRLENTRNPGMRALISLNLLDGKPLTPYHVGFILGPCLNAAGRLGDAEDALQLLLCEDSAEAHEKAVILKEMNDSRKSLTEKGVMEASALAASPEYENDTVLVIYLADCHESIAGIIAGKMRERFGKPAFILTDALTSEGDPCLKGSGRSIDGFHMFEELVKAGDLLLKFGGHALAAGLSLEMNKLPELKKRLNENSTLTGDDLTVKVRIDMELPFSYINEGVIEELSLLNPLGTGNEKPLFCARNVEFTGLNIVGKNNNVLKGTASDGKGRFDFVYFGSDAPEKKDYIERGKRDFKILYYPEINEFRGTRRIQICVSGIR